MRSAILRQNLIFGTFGTALLFLASFASAATITGAVKGLSLVDRPASVMLAYWEAV